MGKGKQGSVPGVEPDSSVRVSVATAGCITGDSNTRDESEYICQYCDLLLAGRVTDYRDSISGKDCSLRHIF